MSSASKAGNAENEKAGTTATKIGLVRFLQKFPQKRGIEALLKSKYESAVKTETEWKAVVDQLLSSKAK